ncbi:MAG: ribonuclease R [Clostridia bacterium]|nr:ribonuclease R [Clostridia bacterium]
MENEFSFADLEPRGPLQVKNTVVGILRNVDGSGVEAGVVIPDAQFKDANQIGAIKIDRNHLNGAPFDMRVVCEILNPEAVKGKFRGKVIEVLGGIDDDDAKMLSLYRQFGLSPDFPEAVKESVQNLPLNPTEDDINEEFAKGRVDLRGLLTITIDGEEAKDLDDAITVKRLANGDFKLFVHIADVSHYVQDETILDKEARLRATSVYLADRVIPMLPPKLSNGLCSLNPHVDRLTMTAEMIINRNNGEIIDGHVYESVINSDRRMSYNECYRILFEDEKIEDQPQIVDMLWLMKNLTDVLKAKRDARGTLNFNIPETKVILNEDGSVKDVMAYPINYCHGMIEEFMIAANEFIAEYFCSRNYPFVYRIHENPDPIKLQKFARVARNFGAVGTIKNDARPGDLRNYVETIRRQEILPSINTMLLRSLAKAKYSSENCGHYGLASKFYCHFTSPIRRYPDLYIHRIIKSFLHKKNKKRYFANKVDEIAQHSSDMERNSVDAERASVDAKVALYMSDKVGTVYEAMVSSIIDPGIFVELPNTVEGFVAFRTMNDHYVFDERFMWAMGKRYGTKLTIGSKVKVRLVRVDLTTNHIDFELEEEMGGGRPPRSASSRSSRLEERSSRGRKSRSEGRSSGKRSSRDSGKSGRSSSRKSESTKARSSSRSSSRPSSRMEGRKASSGRKSSGSRSTRRSSTPRTTEF